VKKIYLAAPLFNPQEIAYNQAVCQVLEQFFEVHLPQRDGVLIPGNAKDVDQFRQMSAQAYESDLAAIRDCDIVFAVLDGRSIDEGVSFELGYGVALGKCCVGLLTDRRVLLPHGINPMIACGLVDVLTAFEAVAPWAEGLKT